MTGNAATAEEHSQFASFMMVYFGQLDAQKDWTKQLHLGALRNVNTRELKAIGPDAGFDSIGDSLQASTLAAYLDRLERENALPKMVLYNVNPGNNYVFATMAGNFPSARVAGRAPASPRRSRHSCRVGTT